MLKNLESQKATTTKKVQTQVRPALFCLINVMYTIKAAHRVAGIYIMTAL